MAGGAKTAGGGVEARSSLPLGLPRPLPCPFLPLPLPLSRGLLLPLPLPLAMSGSGGLKSLISIERGMGQWLGQVRSLEQEDVRE